METYSALSSDAGVGGGEDGSREVSTRVTFLNKQREPMIELHVPDNPEFLAMLGAISVRHGISTTYFA